MATLGTAIELLTSAMKSNIIPNQEYLLQGSVLDQYVEVLLHRLRGLCDNVDSGPETFNDHELCYSLRSNTANSPMVLPLRVRRALDVTDAPFQLRYVGQQEMGDKNRPTVVRSCIDMACSSTIIEFLTELGCRLDFEYIARGYMFRKGRMKVTVSKIFKMNGMASKPEGVEAISQSYLVELSVQAPLGQDAIAEDMRIFAEQLKPLVQLEKIDYKRLGNMIYFPWKTLVKHHNSQGVVTILFMRNPYNHAPFYRRMFLQNLKIETSDCSSNPCGGRTRSCAAGGT